MLLDNEYLSPLDHLNELSQILNIIFNLINFHGHLRLSGVCKHWSNLVGNDSKFMRTVKFKTDLMIPDRKLMRCYKYLDFNKCRIGLTVVPHVRYLLKNAETIDFGDNMHIFNRLLPLCENLKEVLQLGSWPPLSFEYPLPVKISLFNIDGSVQFRLISRLKCIGYNPLMYGTIDISNIGQETLDCFNVVTSITQLELNTTPSIQFMTKYGAVIKSLTISSNVALDYLSQFDNLHLQSMRLKAFSFTRREITPDTVHSFFEKQAPYLETIEIKDLLIGSIVLNAMTMLLQNLVTVKFNSVIDPFLNLNDLKVLTKLKCLYVNLKIMKDSDNYHLDVCCLTKLAELHISCSALYNVLEPRKLRVISQTGPMNSLEKIEISNFCLDWETLEQITQVMPRLKTLDIRVVRK
jgi:hypothetical protein